MTTLSRLDRLVDIQQRVVSRDRFGAEVEAWNDLATVWARVRLTGVREQYVSNADREQALRNAIMRIRYREDITAARHRIVYEDHAWDIIGLDEIGYRRYLDLTVRTELGGVRFLPTGFNIMAGISDDATPEAAEFTIGHVGGRIVFPMFTDKHVVLWRAADEPDLTVFVFVNDPTRENQFTGFMKHGAMVNVGGVDGNAWVSTQMLTFPDEREVDVG